MLPSTYLLNLRFGRGAYCRNLHAGSGAESKPPAVYGVDSGVFLHWRRDHGVSRFGHDSEFGQVRVALSAYGYVISNE